MKLLLLNYPYLKPAFVKLGHQVISAGHYPECDIRLSVFSYSEIIAKVQPADYQAVIYADGLDDHFLYSGMESFSCPTIYIGIDSPINWFWQQHFARNFDLIFFDQLPQVRAMQAERGGCYPLLLGFDQDIFKDYGLPKEFDITFAGRRNDATRPKRTNLLKMLEAQGFKINLIDGVEKSANSAELAQIYNRSRVVINENLFPSLNLRLFEALGSGALVFTEDSCADLSLYFTPGSDLITYNAENIIEQLKFYLNNPAKADLIASAGCQKAHQWHTDIRRAQFVIARLLELDSSRKERSRSPVHTAEAALWAFLKWPGNPSAALHQSLITDFYNSSENHNQDLQTLLLKIQIGVLGRDCHTVDEMLKQVEILKINDPTAQNALFWAARQCNQTETAAHLLTAVRPDLPKKIHSEEDLRMIWADYLFDKGENIRFGLTADLPDIFCTAFDFYRKCSNNLLYAEKALNRMAEILINGQAYDFAARIYEKLADLMPANAVYPDKSAFYQKRSYGVITVQSR